MDMAATGSLMSLTDALLGKCSHGDLLFPGFGQGRVGVTAPKKSLSAVRQFHIVVEQAGQTGQAGIPRLLGIGGTE